MRKGKAELAAATLLLVAPAAGHAQDFTPRTEFEELTGEPKPMPEIPGALRSIAAAPSPDEIVVTGLQGQPIRLDFSWYVPIAFHRYQDGRFLGIEVSGYEDYGYILVDRAATADRAEIGTGQAPVFSPDGRFFAAAELSESGWSNLEGVAVWEVLPGRSELRYLYRRLPAVAGLARRPVGGRHVRVGQRRALRVAAGGQRGLGKRARHGPARPFLPQVGWGGDRLAASLRPARLLGRAGAMKPALPRKK